jgi:hypothetical protein
VLSHGTSVTLSAAAIKAPRKDREDVLRAVDDVYRDVAEG